jgi:ABC-2 type transport system permease protein
VTVVAELVRAIAAFIRVDALEDRRHPLHVVLLVVARLVPVGIHRFVADLVGATTSPAIGSDYFTFGVVGLAMATLIDGALRACGARLQEVQDRGVLEGLLVEPVRWSMIPVSLTAWPAVVHLGAAGGVLTVGAMLGADLRLAGVPVLLLAAGLAVVAASALGTLAGAVLVLAKRADPAVRLYSLGATLIAGTVFPVTLLPKPLQVIGELIPHTHAIHAARQALMTGPPTSAPGLWPSLGWLAVFDLILLPVAAAVFVGALRVARRAGLLGAH